MNYNSQTRNQASLVTSVKFWILTFILILVYSTFIFAQNIVYIDPGNSGDPNQDGTMDHPYDTWSDFTIESNSSYLQKKGTSLTRTQPVSIVGRQNVYLGSYGEGPKPIIHKTSGSSDNILVHRSQNVVIDGYELKGWYNDGWVNCGVGAGGSITSTDPWVRNVVVKNCDMHELYNAFRALPYYTGMDYLQLYNCNIWDIDEDGVYIQRCDNVIIEGCHVWNVNLAWWRGATSPGDGIQLTDVCRNWLVKDNILDRRSTANKFAFIYGSAYYNPEGRGRFIGNTVYSPKDTIGDQGGCGIYIQNGGYVEIAYNKFIGRGYYPGGHGQSAMFLAMDTVDFYYNIGDSTGDGGVVTMQIKVLRFNNNTWFSDVVGSGEAQITISGILSGEFRNNIFAGCPTNGQDPIDFVNSDGIVKSNNKMMTGNPASWNSYFGVESWENSNFKITENSTARNAGFNYNEYHYDIDSISVPQENMRDMGAFEYTDGGQTNNSPPVITNQNFNIAENSANGTSVGTVLASDPDAGQTLYYSIIGGNTSNAFAINSGTGGLTVNNTSALNFENITTFGLTVKVQDNGQGSLSSQATVTINLTNVNENPVIGNQAFTIAENSANGSSVGTVVASDPDAGQTLYYSIIGGNTSNAFAINSGTGGLTVSNANALNFENITTFGLTVKVQDNGQGNLFSQATVTINLTNVNENPVIGNQAFTIAENSANGSSVGTVVASDPDAGQTLTYSITAGNTSTAFAINASTGAITVNNTAALNFETVPSFGLTVRAQDNGTGNLFAQATMTVNIINVNESPVITDQMFTIPENSPNGYPAGLVIASDPDNGQLLIYSILEGNTDNAFIINSLSGELVVANSAAINSTINPVFNLLVEVMDDGSGNLSSEATITVNVTDLNQPPQIGNQSFSVVENSPNGQPVGTVIASDPDAGQTLTYSIISGNSGNAFQINTSTGAISVNNGSVLNYEVIPSFGLIVRVQDNGPGALYSQATVIITLTNVNENPAINNQTFYIAENSSNGTSVGTVIASDPDAGQTLTYSITAGNTSTAFAINASTGAITVNNTAALNYETVPSFGLTVRAQDNGTGNLFSQATVTVSIINVNEIPVITEQMFTIPENSPNGYSAGIVIASDPDNGQILSYTILEGNTDNAFMINSLSGELVVANSAAINSGINPVFSLLVEVMDDGSGNLSSEATITVNVTDLNQPPQIGNQSFSVVENSPNGQTIGTVIASDPDAGQSLTYLIIDGNTDNAFQINGSNGEITVDNSDALNFESITTFGLTIQVQDNGQGNLFAQATVNINLTDVNEVPVIEDQSLDFNLNAGAIFRDINASLIPIGFVSAFDPDAGQNITYTIEGEIDVRGIFSLNAVTGELSIVDPKRLNLIEYYSYPLLIKVVDDSPESLYSHAVFTLNIHIIGLQYFLEGQEGGGISGIEDPSTNVIAYSIYPNPANSFINVEIENLEPGNLTLSVLTLNGELKFSEEHSSVGGTFKNSFNIETLSKGMYIMQIKNGSSMRLEKFIKL